MCPGAGWALLVRLHAICGLWTDCNASERGHQFHAPDGRIADKAGEVVEIDAAIDGALVEHIASEYGHLVFAVGADIARAKTNLSQVFAAEFHTAVQEEINPA